MAKCSGCAGVCNCFLNAGSNVTITGSGTELAPFVISSTGAAGGDAIITVAAADTPAIIAANADFVCDGTDDQVEIQAAIDSLGPAPQGGLVRLLQGTFNTTAPISPAESSILEGSGRADMFSANFGSTVISYTTAVTTFPNAHAIAAFSTTGVTIRDLVVECLTADTGCISAETSADCTVTNCLLYQDVGGNTDVVTVGGFRNRVSDCAIYGVGSVGIKIQADGDGIWITNNTIQAETGIHIDGGEYRTITGNQIQPTSGALGHGIMIDSADYVIVRDNTIVESGGNAIQVEGGSQFCVLSDNIIREPVGIGIHVEENYYSLIHNNIVESAGSDGIRISGASEENSVQGNMIRFTGVAINVLGAAAVANLVTNNDHKGMSITNTGTGTVFTAGNRS